MSDIVAVFHILSEAVPQNCYMLFMSNTVHPLNLRNTHFPDGYKNILKVTSGKQFFFRSNQQRSDSWLKSEASYTIRFLPSLFP